MDTFGGFATSLLFDDFKTLTVMVLIFNDKTLRRPPDERRPCEFGVQTYRFGWRRAESSIAIYVCALAP